jgi:hypothetical protein
VHSQQYVLIPIALIADKVERPEPLVPFLIVHYPGNASLYRG